MQSKNLCVHGHFYQPPREDPLTGEIPVEPGAAPYRNWNERIHAQCYKPNALIGNFEKISFNIGPTLVQWMMRFDPETMRMIVAQEHKNFKQYGVGNGMAQAYNHTILPLASLEDKRTQIRWGIADFAHYFGHAPQGMWLPETAADDETLLVLAENGITFTILAPWQATANKYDTTVPYLVKLPGGRSITVFFYNRDLSTRVSFDPASTVNADRFAQDVINPTFDSNQNRWNHPQMMTIASDGELYGHHQPFRDKFLAYLMESALAPLEIERTYPGLWLKQQPAQNQMGIVQKSSWSCHHGVERWQGSCDCTPNEWKAPLRKAMNQLAAAIDEQYLAVIGEAIDEPWELRHRYIEVMHGNQTIPEVLEEMSEPVPPADQQRQFGLLLGAQMERQRMFTSCGWFFDDFDRIEPRNNVAYAAQAVLLTREATGADLAPLAREVFRAVRSGRSELTAEDVFEQQLRRTEKLFRK